MKIKYLLLPVLTGMMLCGCLSYKSVPFEFADMQKLSDRDIVPEPAREPLQKFALQSGMVIDFYFSEMSALCMLQVNGEQMVLAAFAPAGAKLMEISGTPGKAEKYSFMPGFIGDEALQKKFASQLLQDLANIFINESFLYRGEISGISQERTSCGIEQHDPRLNERRFYGSNRLRLMKKSLKNKHSDWQSRYFRCIIKNDVVYPDQIVYDNYTDCYRLILRVHDFQAGKR